MDRRIIKTENAFMDALIGALAEKPLQKITVKELCERGDYNGIFRNLRLHLSRKEKKRLNI